MRRKKNEGDRAQSLMCVDPEPETRQRWAELLRRIFELEPSAASTARG